MKYIHPVPCFLYFAGILVLSMTIYQPFFLASAVLLLFAVHYSLDGGRALKRYLGMFLFIILFMVVLNPLISHRGATILFYLFDNPITMESVVYGVTNALSLLLVMSSFVLLNLLLDNDRLMFLFSRFAPKTTFAALLCLRYVPLLRRRIGQLAGVQKYQFELPEGARLSDKIRNKMDMLNTLVSWSLEASIYTAQSMRARGYGVQKKRTYYHNYVFSFRDFVFSALICLLAAMITAGWHLGLFSYQIYPRLGSVSFDAYSVVAYVLFLIYMALPILIKAGETIRWRFSKPKI